MKRSKPPSKVTSPNRALRRARLQEKAWTMEELSRRAGVSAQTIRKAEQGSPISEVTMVKIAKALGVAIQKLFPGMEA